MEPILLNDILGNGSFKITHILVFSNSITKQVTQLLVNCR